MFGTTTLRPTAEVVSSQTSNNDAENPQPQQEPSDFKSLLSQTEKAGSTAGTSTTPFNLDHLTREKVGVTSGSPKKDGNRPQQQFFQTLSHLPFSAFVAHFCNRLSSYVSMLCYFYPCLCGTLVFAVIGLILWGLGTLIFNPTVQYGVMKHHDHAFMDSQWNVKAGEIDHWCLRGDNNSCRCEDPLQPTSRADRKSWRLAFKVNRKMSKALVEASRDLDMIFLGESVIEEMDGRWMGQSRSPTLQRMKDLFHSRFDRSIETAQLNAAALGIAGDTAPNVLWRLMHGESENLKPRIWWLSLGMNDLARMQCSEEVTVLGVLRVVEELLNTRPDARIVINSLFPMSELRGGSYPKRSDYQDSFPSAARSGWRSKTSDPSLQVPKGRPSQSHGNNGNRQRRHLSLMERELRRNRNRNKGKSKDEPPPAPMSEEEAADAEDAQYEEKETHKKGFFPRIFGNKKKQNKKNPVLEEQHSIRKHIRDGKLPLWTSVVVVNKELSNFAASHDRVTFFDVTGLFTQRHDGITRTLNTDLISITGHPTSKGFEVWEDAVVEQGLVILKDMRTNQPELFPTTKPGDSATDNSHDDTDPLTDVLNFEGFPEDDDFADDKFFQTDDDWQQDVPDSDGNN